MKAKYANPFITSAVSVFRSEFDIELSRQDMARKEHPKPSFPIAIIIGLTGLVRGQVVYSMEKDFAHEIAKKMLPGRLPVQIDQLTNSAVSEMANIITGRASIDLAGDTGISELTPPAVVAGNNLRVDFINLPTISLKFLSTIGRFEVNVAFKEGTNHG